ncbi:hypothetical protein Ocin01_17778 [Orchesella cincta]|uniref:Uncharacterized protein n=1 Tax=Orchesella cincta TaxID=48709 RepID=A0A1D2M7K7_ORCCI|nr:hypothetical protein Ocin01_17778 [Orchesella cincta]
MLDDETDSNNEDANDPTERIIEQPSIYSPSHSPGGWDIKGATSNHISSNDDQHKRKSRTSQKPILVSTHQSSSEANEDSHQAKSSTVVGSGSHLGQEKSPNGNGTNSDIRVIYLISQGISAYDFISRNSHTLWLYIAVSVASALLLLFLLLLLNFACRRRRRLRRNNRIDGGGGGGESSTSGKESVTLRRSTSGLSDTDELSVVMEPDEYIHLPSIIRRGDDISSFTTVGPSNPNRTVVRFSNSRSSALSRQESDTNPRSLTSPHSNDPDLHFFYG